LLSSLGRLPFIQAVQAIYAGLFTNEILPIRAGDMVQVYVGSRFIGRTFASVLPSLMVGALIDGLWMTIAIGVIAEFLPLPAALAGVARWFTLFIVVCAGVLGTLMVRHPRAVVRWSQQPQAGWAGKLRGFAGQMLFGLEQMRPIPDLALAFAYSGGIPLLGAVAFWLAMQAYGLQLPLYAAATVFLTVRLGTAIPNAPSNLGTYQLFTVVGLQMFGVDKTQAAGFSVVVFIVLTLPFWILGFVALGRSGLTLKAIREDLHKWVASPAH
jgi:uncharacterized membrane protein YbhN (UPF0104 family)